MAEVIFADPTVLSTLSRREVVEGLAEAIKMGVIRDAQLFEEPGLPGLESGPRKCHSIR